MKSALLQFRYAATGRWAVSINTYLVLVFPFGFLLSVEREQLINGVGITRAVTIALFGDLAAGLYLFIAQLFLLGDRKTKLQPLSRCVFIWVSTGIARGVFTALYAHWAFGYGVDLSLRLPSAVLYTAGAMAVTAFYSGTIVRKLLETQALNSLGGMLLQDRLALNLLEVSKRQEVLSVFTSELFPQVLALRSGIQKLLVVGDKDNAHGLHQLLAQSQEISKALNAMKEEYEQGITDLLGESKSRSQIPYWSHLMPKIISIRLTLLVLILGSASAQFFRNGIMGAVTEIMGAIIVVTLLAPLGILMKRSPSNFKFYLVIAIAGAFSTQYLITLLQPTLGINLLHPYLPWYSGVKTVYWVYVASVIASLLVNTGKEFTGAQRESANIRGVIQELSTRDEVIEKSLFNTRFGTLQGKIAGVSMALHLLDSNSLQEISSDRKKELLESANSLLGESLGAIESLTLKAE